MSVTQGVSTIGVQELEMHARDVLRRDRGEVIDVADGGAILARLIPVPPVNALTREETMERRQRLIEAIDKAWPEGVSAADAIADIRRDL